MNFQCLECGTDLDFITAEKEGPNWRSEIVCPNCGCVYRAYVVKRNIKVKL